MPMLAAETASTTAKPSMTFARNRKVGSLSDIDRGQTCLDNPTSNPRLLSETQQNRECRPGVQMGKLGEIGHRAVNVRRILIEERLSSIASGISGHVEKPLRAALLF